VSKTEHSPQVTNYVHTNPSGNSLLLRASELKVKDRNSEDDRGQYQDEIEVKVDADNWQRFGCFGCVLGDKLQEDGQG